MPADPSRRFGLHAPSGGDPADVPADVLRLRDQLDLVTLGYDQGDLSARPSAGVEGRMYYATDRDVAYYDTGSRWSLIGGPTVVTSQLADRAVTSRKVALTSAYAALAGDHTPAAGASQMTSVHDVWTTNLSLTLETQSYVIATAVFDFSAYLVMGEEKSAQGVLAVNGANQSRGVSFAVGGPTQHPPANRWATLSQTYRISLAAGTHAFILRAQQWGTSTAAATLQRTGTSLTLLAFSA
jgi:hypothetical protein